jgi:hypothetical protein
MPSYPSSLPAPLVSGYGVSTVFDLSSVEFERGNTRQRQGARRETTAFTLSFLFSTAELWAWQSWANANGWDWHTMDLQSPYSAMSISGAAAIPHSIRYTSEQISMSFLGNGIVNVTVQAELDVTALPQGIYAYTGDWIVAGTPASPSSANWYIAGTPASPAADFVIAGTPAMPAA